MSPVGGKGAIIPVLGEDDNELEIVQYGARLTPDQIKRGEALGITLARRQGRFSNKDTAGPADVREYAGELRSRISLYQLRKEIGRNR